MSFVAGTINPPPSVTRCPVCNGSGVVAKGFYHPYPFFSAGDTAPDECRTCEGSGVVEVVRFSVGDGSRPKAEVRPA